MTLNLTKSAVMSALLFTAPISAQAASPSAEKEIDVYIDQTQLLHLGKAMGTIVVGNPEIATAAVHDNHTLLLTGLKFGTTNLIVLDSLGRPIHKSLLLVSERSGNGILTVARGQETNTYACSQKCRPVKSDIQPGLLGPLP